MTQDVKLVRTTEGIFDLLFTGKVLATVDGFETAIIVSLGTDARAPSSTVRTPSRRRGWVGNILTASTGRQLGSLLWTFDQARLTPATLNDLGVAAENALAWMVEDNLARSVAASVSRTGLRSARVDILIVTIEGKELRYAYLWRQTGAL